MKKLNLMPKAAWLRATILPTALLAAASFAEAAGPALNQPLECMKKYKFKEFPVVAWCFHNYEGTDYSDEYAKKVEGVNFNAVIETGYMMKSYEKTKVKVILSTLISDTLHERDVWGTKRTHPVEKAMEPADAHAKYGKSPALIGYHVGSKYGAHPLPKLMARRVRAVEDQKAGLFPWVASIWDVDGHVKAGGMIVSATITDATSANVFIAMKQMSTASGSDVLITSELRKCRTETSTTMIVTRISSDSAVFSVPSVS